MSKIKLSEYCKRNSISYITGYRWFKAGELPGAIQSSSGTILVEEEAIMDNNSQSHPNNVMSHFLKKTVEYSKNNSTVEDFAAYILSNFNLKINSNAADDSLKYSKNKPSKEEINNHFNGFLAKAEKPAASMFLVSADKLSTFNDENLTVKRNDDPTFDSMSSNFVNPNNLGTVVPYDKSTLTSMSTNASFITEIDTNLSAISDARMSNLSFNESESFTSSSLQVSNPTTISFPSGPTGCFVPTQKELEQSDLKSRGNKVKRKK